MYGARKSWPKSGRGCGRFASTTLGGNEGCSDAERIFAALSPLPVDVDRVEPPDDDLAGEPNAATERRRVEGGALDEVGPLLIELDFFEPKLLGPEENEPAPFGPSNVARVSRELSGVIILPELELEPKKSFHSSFCSKPSLSA